jgi:hypothetical protein
MDAPSLASTPLLATEPAQQQHQMQDDQLKAALDAIRNAVTGVKSGGTRLCHDGAIETMDVTVVVTAPKRT